MDFECTNRFNQDIADLTRRSKDGYSSVKGDIVHLFKGKDIDTIYGQATCLRQYTQSRLVKVRVKNSGASLGSSNGFRLIYIANKKTNKVILLHVYPKRGALQKVSVDDKELAEILTELSEQLETDTLTAVDFLSEKREGSEEVLVPTKSSAEESK